MLKVTKTLSLYDAGYHSQKNVKSAFIAYMKALPYELHTLSDGSTIAFGSMHAYDDCKTNHGTQAGIQKLLYGSNHAQVSQLQNFVACDVCGCAKVALCHTMPKSHGATPCVNNITVDCADCNHRYSNQILTKAVTTFMHTYMVTFDVDIDTID